MAKILKTFLEETPDLILVGKRYTDADRDQYGSFGEKWGQWFGNGWFDRLEKCGSVFEGSYVGAMRITEAGFEYWIGMLLTEAAVPEDFESVEIPAGDLAVCYLYGSENGGEIYGMHDECVAAWQEQGWKPTGWFMERYNCPRFTTPDEQGNVILDYCAWISKEGK